MSGNSSHSTHQEDRHGSHCRTHFADHALVAAILILILPRLLNYVVVIYLIVVAYRAEGYLPFHPLTPRPSILPVQESAKTIRVLVVEDEPIVGMTIGNFLGGFGKFESCCSSRGYRTN